jgi:hypothetical protein
MTNESTETTTQQEEMDKFWQGYQDPNQSRLDALTAETLTPMVRRAVGCATATVTAWHYRIIKGAGGDAGEGRGVYRFWGQADDAGPAMDWSMMLKVVRLAKGRARS